MLDERCLRVGVGGRTSIDDLSGLVACVSVLAFVSSFELGLLGLPNTKAFQIASASSSGLAAGLGGPCEVFL